MYRSSRHASLVPLPSFLSHGTGAPAPLDSACGLWSTRCQVVEMNRRFPDLRSLAPSPSPSGSHPLSAFQSLCPSASDVQRDGLHPPPPITTFPERLSKRGCLSHVPPLSTLSHAPFHNFIPSRFSSLWPSHVSRRYDQILCSPPTPQPPSSCRGATQHPAQHPEQVRWGWLGPTSFLT